MEPYRDVTARTMPGYSPPLKRRIPQSEVHYDLLLVTRIASADDGNGVTTFNPWR
jgi:hypothetical protein